MYISPFRFLLKDKQYRKEKMKTKKAIGIVAILFAVFLMGDVNAYQVYSGTFYEAEKIEGVYFYKHREDTESESYKYHNFHSQASIIRKTSDNNIVYCVESWEILTGSKNGDHVDTEKDYPAYISYETSKKIEALAYFGYGYKDLEYDHTNPLWYAITQYLIWEAEAPNIEHYFVSSLDSTTPIYPYTKEINELNELVRKYLTRVEFDYYSQQNMIVGEPHTFKDKNGVLKDYQVIAASDIKINSISNNEISLTVLSPGKQVINLLQTYKYYGKTYKYYQSEKYQDMLEPGNLGTVRYSLVFNTNSDDEESREGDYDDFAGDDNCPDAPDEEFNGDESAPDNTGDLEENENEEMLPSNEEDKEIKEETDEGYEDFTNGKTDEKLEEDSEKESTENKDIEEENPSNKEEIEEPVVSEDTKDNDISEDEDIPLKNEEPEDTENKEIVDNSKNDDELPNEEIVALEKPSILPQPEEINAFDTEKKEESVIDTSDSSDSIFKEKIEMLNKDFNSDFSPVDVEVPATGASSLSFIFYLVSILGLCFVKYAK